MNGKDFQILETEELASSSVAETIKRKNIVVLNKISRWCVYILLALMPLWFLPFTVNITNFNKQFLMIVVLTVTLIAWLGKLLSQEKMEDRKSVV